MRCRTERVDGDPTEGPWDTVLTHGDVNPLRRLTLLDMDQPLVVEIEPGETLIFARRQVKGVMGEVPPHLQGIRTIVGKRRADGIVQVVTILPDGQLQEGDTV